MKCNAVGGCVDDPSIANNFAQYFSQIYTPNSSKRAALCAQNTMPCVLDILVSQ